MAIDRVISKSKNVMSPNLPFKIYRFRGKLNQTEHAHDYIQIWYVKYGECIHNFNGVPHRLTQNDIFVLPPYAYHSLESENSCTELIGMEFTESFISGALSSENDLFDYAFIESFIVSLDCVKPTFALEGYASKNIETLLEETIFEFENKKDRYELYLKANAMKILAIITREYGKRINDEKKGLLIKYKQSVNTAVNYIRENYRKKIYLDDICRYTAMSAACFCYVFKRVTGRTLTEYVNYVRIERAKDLLKSENKTIAGVAYESGFSEATYFTKVFKKETGCSPLKYRKNKIIQ